MDAQLDAFAHGTDALRLRLLTGSLQAAQHAQHGRWPREGAQESPCAVRLSPLFGQKPSDVRPAGTSGAHAPPSPPPSSQKAGEAHAGGGAAAPPRQREGSSGRAATASGSGSDGAAQAPRVVLGPETRHTLKSLAAARKAQAASKLGSRSCSPAAGGAGIDRPVEGVEGLHRQEGYPRQEGQQQQSASRSSGGNHTSGMHAQHQPESLTAAVRASGECGTAGLTAGLLELKHRLLSNLRKGSQPTSAAFSTSIPADGLPYHRHYYSCGSSTATAAPCPPSGEPSGHQSSTTLRPWAQAGGLGEAHALGEDAAWAPAPCSKYSLHEDSGDVFDGAGLGAHEARRFRLSSEGGRPGLEGMGRDSSEARDGFSAWLADGSEWGGDRGIGGSSPSLGTATLNSRATECGWATPAATAAAGGLSCRSSARNAMFSMLHPAPPRSSPVPRAHEHGSSGTPHTEPLRSEAFSPAYASATPRTASVTKVFDLDTEQGLQDLRRHTTALKQRIEAFALGEWDT
jgi:hypothetical protein